LAVAFVALPAAAFFALATGDGPAPPCPFLRVAVARARRVGELLPAALALRLGVAV
jgi:hypothetical protein